MSAYLIVRVYQILSNEMLDFRVCVSQKHITLTQPNHKISNSVSKNENFSNIFIVQE